MAINSDKTEAIIFTRRVIAMPPAIRVEGYEVPWAQRVKYLGIFLDSRMRWRHAIADRVTKTSAAMRALYPLINHKNKLNFELKVLLYKVCARTILLYAAPVWAPAAEIHLKKLQIVQNRFLRVILGLPRTTHIDTLHEHTGVQYIDTVINSMLLKAYRPDHENELVAKLGDYDVDALPFKTVRCRLPKHFQPKHN